MKNGREGRYREKLIQFFLCMKMYGKKNKILIINMVIILGLYFFFFLLIPHFVCEFYNKIEEQILKIGVLISLLLPTNIIRFYCMIFLSIRNGKRIV